MTLKGSRTVATGGVEKRASRHRALHRPTSFRAMACVIVSPCSSKDDTYTFPLFPGARLTHSATADEVHNRQQDDGAQQREEQRGQAEVALIDGANAEEWRE
jgi:hypothetical protein